MIGSVPQPARRQDAFAYQCNACGRCCRGKRIQVSPFEMAALAGFLGISTEEALRRFCDDDIPIYLRWAADKSCIFFDSERGCTVHAARPLVCRLYPLGRTLNRDGLETFTSATPHPQTEGVYSRNGTVADWIRSQRADAYIAEVDNYYRLYLELVARLEALEGEASTTVSKTISWDLEKHWLDVDGAIAEHCAANRLQEPSDLHERAALHRRIICQHFGLTES